MTADCPVEKVILKIKTISLYHGLARAMDIRTVRMEQMSHLYVVISHLLHVLFFDSTLMALFAAH